MSSAMHKLKAKDENGYTLALGNGKTLQKNTNKTNKMDKMNETSKEKTNKPEKKIEVEVEYCYA